MPSATSAALARRRSRIRAHRDRPSRSDDFLTWPWMVPPSFSQLCAFTPCGSPTPTARMRSKGEPDGASTSRVANGLPVNVDHSRRLLDDLGGIGLFGRGRELGAAGGQQHGQTSLRPGAAGETDFDFARHLDSRGSESAGDLVVFPGKGKGQREHSVSAGAGIDRRACRSAARQRRIETAVCPLLLAAVSPKPCPPSGRTRIPNR